jgi:hypothetical protein
MNDLTPGSFSRSVAFLGGCRDATATGNIVWHSPVVSQPFFAAYFGGDNITVTGNSYRCDSEADPGNDATNLTISGNTPLDVGDWDTTPPTCSFEVEDGEFIDSTTGIVVTATDDDSGIARVYFAVDGLPAGFDDTAPYTFTFDPDDYPAGDHVISARAIDHQANLGPLASVTIESEPGGGGGGDALLTEGGDGILLESGDALLI